MTRTRMVSLATAGVVALGLTGCGDVVLHSAALDTPIVVDGHYGDWDGQMTWVNKAKMSVGARNDGTDLYVVLAIGDRDVQRTIMMSGMFLWFDPAGGQDGQFGIHYPLGLRDPERFIGQGSFGGYGGERVGDRDETGEGEGDVERRSAPRRRGDEREMFKEFREEALAEVEMIGAGGASRITRSPRNLPGVQVAAGMEHGTMVFEYRIPLAAPVDAPWGVGSAPGATVGVGIMTPEIDLSRMREEMRERMQERGGTRRPPGGEGMGGDEMGEGMRPGMGGPKAPEPIDLWATLVLAPAAAD